MLVLTQLRAAWTRHRQPTRIIWSSSLASVHKPRIKLRPYQEESIQSVLSYLAKGHKRLGLSLATGAGKTVIFTQLIDRLQPPSNTTNTTTDGKTGSTNSHATQTLILAHRRELVEQAANHCRAAYPDKSVDIEMCNLHASGAADITVASIQSLRSAGRIDKYNPRRFKLVLVDEAHHIVAPGYLQVLQHFGLYTPPPLLPRSDTDTGETDTDTCSNKSSTAFQPDAPVLVGVSATFSRFDGVRLGAAIDHIVYHKDYIDMINDQWLSPVSFTTVRSKADLASVRTNKDGDFQTGQLSRAVNTPETNEITFTAWQSEASGTGSTYQGRKCKSTLIFCVDVSHVKDLTSTFRRHGVDARYITGTTKPRERSDLLQQFKDGRFPVLINCAVFTEGTDMPNIDCVVLARPTKSRNLLVQMIGRGMRLHQGKTNCHVIDMVASLETGIVTVPTLFGLDPGELLNNASAIDLKKGAEERESTSTTSTPGNNSNGTGGGIARDVSNHTLSFTHYSSVQDLIEDTSGERHIRALSPNAWVQLDTNKYILNARGGILTLEHRAGAPTTASSSSSGGGTAPYNGDFHFDVDGDGDGDSDTFVAIWKYPLPPGTRSKSPYSKPRIVASASTFTAALRAADTFAATKFERIFIATSSSWRKGPASEGQLAFLNKLRQVGADEADEADGHDVAGSALLTPNDLTKGQAADMITKIKYGARGRFDRLQVKKRRVEREQLRHRKMNDLLARERVTVGPLLSPSSSSSSSPPS